MLYDILIVDNDFSGESESKEWNDNAKKLLCDLIADNLRVIWTTGESEDLRRLKEKDLSTIKYIFLDLHLVGITNSSSYKQINSTLLGVIQAINGFVRVENVTCFINSKYFSNDYGSKGATDLEEQLSKKFQKKYKLAIVEKKNSLSDEQKDELKNYLLVVYAKTLVINKALDVEAIFDTKLEIDDKLKDVITFDNKYKKFKEAIKTNKGTTKSLTSYQTKQIKLLQKIRNTLAHSSIDNLQKITDKDSIKKFWKLQNQQQQGAIQFNNFTSLIQYLQSVDTLCEELKELKVTNENKA